MMDAARRVLLSDSMRIDPPCIEGAIADAGAGTPITHSVRLSTVDFVQDDGAFGSASEKSKCGILPGSERKAAVDFRPANSYSLLTWRCFSAALCMNFPAFWEVENKSFTNPSLRISRPVRRGQTHSLSKRRGNAACSRYSTLAKCGRRKVSSYQFSREA